jgi:diguanylate cyclase (GGDEF)-like protein
LSVEEELRRANALLAAHRRLQAATSALLDSNSPEELERKIVDVLPGAIGFERVALLAPPAQTEPAKILHALGYPQLRLDGVPKHSPLAAGGFLDGQRTGYEDDDDAPHSGVRGAYVLAPLRDRNQTAALLYADTLRDGVELADAAADVAYALDIAAIVRANLSLAAQLAELARTDALTQLPNRRVFEERVRQELQRSWRSRRPFALLILDLDRFKEINDRYGHAGGDEALRAFADTIQAHARQSDFVGRFAGDEFAMLLVDVDRAGAHAIVDRLLAAVRDTELPMAATLSASVGVAMSLPADTPETLFERADAALYDAKSAGRDCARFT